MSTESESNESNNATKAVWFLIIGGFIAIVVVAIMHKKKKKSDNVKFVPASSGMTTWSNPQDMQNCMNAFNDPNFDQNCQANPGADPEGCSDYPAVFCSLDGTSPATMNSTGDLNFNGCQGPMAYGPATCKAPLAPVQGYLCGGSLDPCVPKSSGMNCSQTAPPNPWGATNVCSN